MASDGELRADIVLRTQKWEQSERLVVSKNSTLEARLLALERRTGDSDALLGGLKVQVEGLQELQDQVAAMRAELGQGLLAQVHDELGRLQDGVRTELGRISEALGQSTGGWQAAVAMARQAAKEQLAQVSAALEALQLAADSAAASAAAASEQAARAHDLAASSKAEAEQAGEAQVPPEVVAHVEAAVNTMAEHLARELGAATAQQSAAVTEPMRAAIDELQAHHEAAARRLDEVAAALAAQQAEADALRSDVLEVRRAF